MLFNSWHFIVFLLIVLSVACWLPRYGRAWKIFLIAASCYFYGQWSWKYLSLIALTATVDYVIAQRLAGSASPRKLITISLVANLGVLAFFKYANFLIATMNGLGDAAGAAWQITPLDIILPVGISFYTFQNMSYTIDVYRGHLAPRKSPLDYAVFTTFFPQLLAGPIVRASEFFTQLDRPNPITLRTLQYGLVLIAAGYVKKVVLADNLAVSVEEVFSNPAAADPWMALLSVYAFAFQIYFDFSGYTDIAIGLALLFGFEFPKNFDYPYLALSFQEFWRRWHMTLSRWLRDYLYISLGGNRDGLARTMANLMTTMLLGGLWHGASWNFVVWGGLHGAYLALERLALSRLAWWNSSHIVAKAVRWLTVFHLVCFAWIFFRAQDFATSKIIIGKIAAIFVTRPNLSLLGMLPCFLLGLLAMHWAMSQWKVKERLSDAGAMLFAAYASAMVLLLIWFTPSKTVPFIYFQF
jgi:D-alanyl-lipoteichoic acid acyltransferase DltB (MBOAT superfamily)